MSAPAADEAVERHLALRLARVRRAGLADLDELEDACPAVHALTAVGALSPQDASRWSRRFARAALGPEAADPALRERALEHVAQLTRRGADDGARVAVTAFRSLGLLSDQDQLALLAPAALGDEPGRFDAARGFRDGRPLRVLPGRGERIGGLRVTVIELFDAAVVLHWHFSSAFAKGWTGEELSEELGSDEPLFATGPPPTSETVLRMAAPLIGLEDGRGTDYTGFRCEEVRSSPDAVGRSGFVPGLPRDARSLGVAIGDDDLLQVEL